MKRVKMIVCGRVQGVGYRYFVQEKAREFGIKGYVRNLPEGDVEIDAEGDRNDLEIFISTCKEGPNFSNVRDLVIHTIPLFGFQKFIIRY